MMVHSNGSYFVNNLALNKLPRHKVLSWVVDYFDDLEYPLLVIVAVRGTEFWQWKAFEKPLQSSPSIADLNLVAATGNKLSPEKACKYFNEIDMVNYEN